MPSYLAKRYPSNKQDNLEEQLFTFQDADFIKLEKPFCIEGFSSLQLKLYLISIACFDYFFAVCKW